MGGGVSVISTDRIMGSGEFLHPNMISKYNKNIFLYARIVKTCCLPFFLSQEKMTLQRQVNSEKAKMNFRLQFF